MTESSALDRLEIFFGQSSESLCYVYARLALAEIDDAWTLGGSLRGPSCEYAATLPAIFRFSDQGPGDSLLARAVVPEPSVWTPEMPHVYQAEIELRHGDKVVATASRLFGIRTLGSAGHKLIYGGKRWVLRGVRTDEVPTTDMKLWHESDTALVVANPTNALCEQASRVGVLLVAELAANQVEQLERLSRWPAVGVVTLPSDAAPQVTRPTRNLILAARRGDLQARAPWASAIVLELDMACAAIAPVPGVATIACRKAGPVPNLSAGRAACDHLQRDVAALGDWAGFLV